MAAIRALLLDLDDTLCDEAGSVAVALEATSRFAAQRLGLGEWVTLAQAYTRVSNALWADFDAWGRGLGKLDARRYVWRAALAGAGYSADESLISHIAAHYSDRRTCHRWLPQARETLLALRQTYRLGLITNGATDMQREKIRCLRLDDLCHVTLVGEECGHSKPHAEIFHRAMQALGVTADEGVMVGNSPETDIVGAHGVGMRTVWVCPDLRPWPLPSPAPWRTIRSVADLPSVLGSA